MAAVFPKYNVKRKITQACVSRLALRSPELTSGQGALPELWLAVLRRRSEAAELQRRRREEGCGEPLPLTRRPALLSKEDS